MYGPARFAVLAVLECQMLVRPESGLLLGVYGLAEGKLHLLFEIQYVFTFC